MIKAVLSSIIILLVSGVLVYADTLPKSALLPSNSVAVTDDAMSIAFNPAGLAVRSGVNAYYLRTFSGDTFSDDVGGDDAVFISLSGLGFGAEFIDSGSVDFKKYTLSDGIKLDDRIYLGTSYSWFSSDDHDYDKLSSWDLGLLYRPFDFLSVGFVAGNLNQPAFQNTQTERMYNFSLAFRPFTEWITFSVDNEFQKGQKIKNSRFIYALEVEPIDGVILRGGYDSYHNFDIRVGIGLSRFRSGVYNAFDEEAGHDGGVVYAHFSSEIYRTKLRRGNRVLKLKAGEFNQLRRAKEDKSIIGAILDLDTDDYSMSKAQEIRDAILDFRSSSKKVVCYMELVGDKGYYLASACDKIVINPAGYLTLNGLSSEVDFYKGTLDKLGVEADLYRTGKYKSATEMFTREGMSDGYRESLNSLLDDLFDQMVSGMAEGRDIPRDQIKEKMDQGPYTAKEAMEASLVDELIYEDQLEDFAEQMLGKGISLLPGREYGNYKYYRYNWKPKPKLAIISATGLIAPGESMFAGGLIPGSIMGAETMTEAIKKVREDDSIKAIVIRIDSGGGSVFASDLIWRELVLTKDEKPIIVSMGSVAASGGYYIACPGDVIVAEPATVTGSIGVIAGKFNLRGLYDKLGIKKEILKRGENSDIFTLYDDFTDRQREIVNRQIQEMYDDFVQKVAQSREMTPEAVQSIAQGRVWTGRQAENNGLIDRLGDFHMALSIAKSKAGLEVDEEVDMVYLPERFSFWRRLIFENNLLSSEMFGFKPFMDLMDTLEGLANERIFFLTPYNVDFE
jgi:protease-4